MSKIISTTYFMLLATLLSLLSACSGNSFLEGRFAPDSNLKNNPTPTLTPEVGSTPTNNSLPSEIPQYPSANLISSDPNNTVNQGKTQWSSSDPINQIGDFYQQQFQNNNWQILTPFSSIDGNNTLVATKDGLQTTITLTGNSSETQFTIDYIRQGNTVTSSPTPSPTVSPNQLPEQASTNFSDLTQVAEPLRTHIQNLGTLGIVNSQNSDSFSPNTTITRGEFARWLVRANNIFYQNDPGKQIRLGATTSQPAFQDVNVSDPDFPYIQGLAEAGIIPSSLTGDTTATLFRPTANLTREILVSWKVPFDLRKGLPTATIDNVRDTWGFQDVAKVDPKVLRSLYADYQNGDQAVIRRVFGYTTLFQPKKVVTRAEAASALWYFGYQGEGINAEEVLQAKNQTQPTQ
ncbi:S-layer homology domain-containing protein [Chroococcus sp. FPU101]|uniref:S-layer homology domain-containing protein n=1 Tax=Chroococcus sp. FPU101 TaxID=1974212 RepID=UPI001A8CB666|nr:S-layer homology domain-containing protein [Chroococcus sp. FPU101]GFE69940.1 S-layer domain protein [Chroococcus sp. FPU101]